MRSKRLASIDERQACRIDEGYCYFCGKPVLGGMAHLGCIVRDRELRARAWDCAYLLLEGRAEDGIVNTIAALQALIDGGKPAAESSNPAAEGFIAAKAAFVAASLPLVINDKSDASIPGKAPSL
jgi:hypothetical protein